MKLFMEKVEDIPEDDLIQEVVTIPMASLDLIQKTDMTTTVREETTPEVDMTIIKGQETAMKGHVMDPEDDKTTILMERETNISPRDLVVIDEVTAEAELKDHITVKRKKYKSVTKSLMMEHKNMCLSVFLRMDMS